MEISSKILTLQDTSICFLYFLKNVYFILMNDVNNFKTLFVMSVSSYPACLIAGNSYWSKHNCLSAGE